MKGYDEKSTEALEDAAEILNLSRDQRRILQTVYNIGMSDGQIKAMRERMDQQANQQVPA